MSNGVDLELLPPGSYLVRVGPPGWSYPRDGQAVEPYDLIMVVIDLGNDECEIRGLDRPIVPSQWRRINDTLCCHGFGLVHFHRHKDGKIVHKALKPCKPF